MSATRLARHYIARTICEADNLEGEARDAMIAKAETDALDDHPKADHCLALAVRQLSCMGHGARVYVTETE